MGAPTWTYEVDEIPVTTGSGRPPTTTAGVFSFTPPNGGIFKITATTRDADGNEVVAANTIWVASREYVSWRQQNSNRIDLIADKDELHASATRRKS